MVAHRTNRTTDSRGRETAAILDCTRRPMRLAAERGLEEQHAEMLKKNLIFLADLRAEFSRSLSDLNRAGELLSELKDGADLMAQQLVDMNIDPEGIVPANDLADLEYRVAVHLRGSQEIDQNPNSDGSQSA